MTAQAKESDPWYDYCKKVVRNFLQNAVIIDDRPSLPKSQKESPNQQNIESQEERLGFQAHTDDDLEFFGGIASEFEESGSIPPKKNISSERQSIKQDTTLDTPISSNTEIDIQLASDAFADEGILCSFLLPHGDTQKPEAIKTRALKLAGPSDLVVIDWYLKNSSPTLTLSILKELISGDCSDNGRLRLVCIYTSQEKKHFKDIIDLCTETLKTTGLENLKPEPELGKIFARNFSLILFNKTMTPVNELPKNLIQAFVPFADGLLPAFALSAVGSVRRQAHHIISQFSKDLDPVYVANRLITDPQGDVGELMRDLFSSECDAAVGLGRVTDLCLENDAIRKWLDNKKQPINRNTSYKYKKSEIPIDRTFIDSLMAGLLDSDNNTISFTKKELPTRPFKEHNRYLISESFYSNVNKQRAAERKLARFVALKREAFGASRMVSDSGWKPSLTLGTLVQLSLNDENQKQYLYCLTPACDTVRLHGKERAFLFLILSESNNPTFVVTSPDGSELLLRAQFKPSNIEKYHFEGDEKLGRVFAYPPEENKSKKNPEKLFFRHKKHKEKFMWLGQVRENRAQRDLSEFVKQWMRFGIIDSEYFRLASKGAAVLFEQTDPETN